MRILYDFEGFIVQRYGGLSRYFYELISNLKNLEDINIYLYMGFHINEYGLQKFKKDFDSFFGIKIPYIPRTKFIISKLERQRFINYRTNCPHDIFHQTYYNKYPRKPGEMIVVTIHDMIHELYPENFPSIDNTSENKQYTALNSDGIICISQSTKRDLIERFNAPENKIKVIYHGNSLKLNVTEPAIHKNPYLFYVGVRKGYKNFDALYKAYKSSSIINSEYNLVCFGGGKFSRKEISAFKNDKLKDKIFHYSGSDIVLANLYKYASLFIYPSKYEGFGIPLLEAMHYGCPIISGDKSSLPEVAGDAAEYFDTESFEDLMNKILKVLNDSALRKNLREKGFEREKLFGWDICSKQTYDFYKELM